VHVDHSRRDIRVPQQALERKRIAAIPNEHGRECVPERMRTAPRDPCTLGDPVNDVHELVPVERVAFASAKERIPCQGERPSCEPFSEHPR